MNAIFVGVVLACASSALAQPVAVVTHLEGSSNYLSVIDTTTDTVRDTIPLCTVGPCPANAVAVDPDGTRAWAASFGLPYLFDVDLVARRSRTIRIPNSPSALALSPDGARLYVGAGDVHVIDTATDAIVASIPMAATPNAIAVAPDGGRVYVTSSNPDLVVIDAATNTPLDPIPLGVASIAVVVHPNGTRLYVSLYSRFVAVVDPIAGTVVRYVRVGYRRNGPSSMAIHPTGSRVYAAVSGGGADSRIFQIDTATETVVGGIVAGADPVGLSVHPDGTRLYVATVRRGHLEVYDTETGRRTQSLPLGDQPGSWGSFVSGLPRHACAAGNVNHGIPFAADVLRVNGSSGDANRVVTSTSGAPLEISLAASPAGSGPGRYALFVWGGAPANRAPVAVLGETIGCTVNPTPATPFDLPQPIRCLHGGDAAPCGGVRGFPRAPARVPWTLARPSGLRAPGTFTLQGILEDEGSGSAVGLSVTNAVEVVAR
jgi:YVTN family beta-propeller protein